MKGELKNIMPLRKRVLLFFLIVIVLIGLLSSVLYYNMAKTYYKFDKVYNNLKILEDYSSTIEKTSADLNKYISESDRSFISSFYQKYDELLLEMKNTDLDFNNIDDNMLFVNIRCMFETYGSEADAAIREYRKRNVEALSYRLSRTLKIQAYIQDEIDALVLSYISESRIFQKDLLNQMVILRALIIILIIMSFTLYIMLAFYLSKALVKPIDMLVKMANRISGGDFDVEPINTSSHGELKMLSDTLYRMNYDIKKYIEEMNNKVEVEKLLQAKEVENLRINALLKETELKRLQAQVNPHFLFNTLTTLHHTAFMEGATETCEIAEAVSKILRYNLRKSNTIVQLNDEIENIKNYIYIQEKRYKHRVKVHFDIDENQLDLPIPNMTVQPIVENSFIHGVENNEDYGEISLRVYKENEFTVVEIKDNGAGIEEEKLNELRNMIGNESDYSGHTSSIGINNVVKRLQAFYNSKDLFHIESTLKDGTIIKLFLPYHFEYRRNATARGSFEAELRLLED